MREREYEGEVSGTEMNHCDYIILLLMYCISYRFQLTKKAFFFVSYGKVCQFCWRHVCCTNSLAAPCIPLYICECCQLPILFPLCCWDCLFQFVGSYCVITTQQSFRLLCFFLCEGAKARQRDCFQDSFDWDSWGIEMSIGSSSHREAVVGNLAFPAELLQHIETKGESIDNANVDGSRDV